MRQSPHDLAADLKETLCRYIETTYRISNPIVSADRAALLRSGDTVSQTPYIETTPRFEAGVRLRDLEIPHIPTVLADLVRYGLPTEKFPLYAHQEKALRAAWAEDGTPRHVIVASGTGSGKTEAFYLPILSDILREALTWDPPVHSATHGEWDGKRNYWMSLRRFEQRPAAVRAIVLYPMNALVNDQLRRLRQMLAVDQALDWQQKFLRGNYIYFGRYTGQTPVPGSPHDDKRRKRWDQYIREIEAGWDAIGEELRKSGGWPRIDGPEMLGRWDMQAHPPDILITNYSMLEYMLVRPLEASMFHETRNWLAQSKENRITLVLDEAHSYTGARGTEVAYLIRRLFERLGASGDQIRCIATSATLGETDEALRRVRTFAAELFGEPEDRFSVVQAQTEPTPDDLPGPSLKELQAFAAFQEALEDESTANDPVAQQLQLNEAVDQLISTLHLQDHGQDSSARLYRALENYSRLLELRQATARRATPFDKVADEVWGTLGDQAQRQDATAALLFAGAHARPGGLEDPDVAPLLPSRAHLMYRGLPGLWACMDSRCTAAPEREHAPCGKLYSESRVWCECGARVLEVFSCRVCGLLFLGGIPDDQGRLWPYEPSLESNSRDYSQFRVVAVEDPGEPLPGGKAWVEDKRSVYTTVRIPPGTEEDLRSVWIPDPEDEKKKEPRNRPLECPRCNARASASREVIEPFQSTGPQGFAVLVEEAFRNQTPRDGKKSQEQPLAAKGKGWGKHKSIEAPTDNPNKGRKAIVFSDGRQDAAMLAGNLNFIHSRDLFRQLLLSTLHEHAGKDQDEIPVPELRELVFRCSLRRGIDPTFGEEPDFWDVYSGSPLEGEKTASPIIDAYLRREMADRAVGVEALGLAQWVLDAQGIDLASEIQALEPFTARETLSLLYAVIRILMGENVIVPKDGNPQSWPAAIIEPYYRRIIVKPPLKDESAFTWAPQRRNRLTRYLAAVAAAANLGTSGVEDLMSSLWEDYLPEYPLEPVAGNHHGWGIPISRMALAPLPECIYVCSSCGYVNAETVKNVCIRCQNHAVEVAKSQLDDRSNYYRHLVDLALGPDGHPDPFPLRVLEHTAQISADEAAKRERYFQDQFIPSGPQVENPAADRVDILSVTTTMEMGIDIGDLSTVGLHNTPPTVANYQQRAGRAGRRSDGLASVLTYARARSHDQYYYTHVDEIITGEVRVPEVHLANEVIAQRHINALVLQRFFHHHPHELSDTLFGTFGTVGQFLRGTPSRISMLREDLGVGTFREEVEAAGQRIASRYAAEVGDWIDEVPGKTERAVSGADESEDLLEVLITKGLLPRYAFPVDLVALWLHQPDKWSQGDEVQRDLQIALSEYAPDAEIIIDGKIYTSAGLYTPFEDDAEYVPEKYFYQCPECRNIMVGDPANWVDCPVCGNRITRGPGRSPVPAIVPRGFRTDWIERAKNYRGGGRDRSGFATRAELHAGEFAHYGEERYSGRLWVHQRQAADLYTTNPGPDPHEPGFWICPKCGRGLKKQDQEHYRPDFPKKKCPGRPKVRSILMHGFKSDVALFAINLPETMDANPKYLGGRAAWRSFGTALWRAAAAHLQIDPGELASGVRPYKHLETGRLLGEVFVYDTLPNGAGYAKEMAANIDAILDLAYELTAHCPANCETACYRCLMEYKNQWEHGLLDRHLAADLLAYVLHGTEPELTWEQQTKALDKLNHFTLPEHDLRQSVEVDGAKIPAVLAWDDHKVSLWPYHTLRNVPPGRRKELSIETGIEPEFLTQFDLSRLPFRVWNGILAGTVAPLE